MKSGITGCVVRTSRRLARGVIFALMGSVLIGPAGAQEALEPLQAALPEAPSALLVSAALQAGVAVAGAGETAPPVGVTAYDVQSSRSSAASNAAASDKPQNPDKPAQAVGADGKPLRPQTGRIFGIFPNFVAVSAGTKPRPAGWKTDFQLANKQAYDYSSFGFLLISSGLAYGQDSHTSLDTEHGGNAIFWAYLWRGFLDKTDGTYQGTFFFPALLHEDTRYYALGTGRPKKRLLHAVESVVVAHTYDGRPTFNAAGLIGRAGAQAVSTVYYPAGSEGFGVLAQKYAYSTLRNVIYAVVREFSPDAQAWVHSKRKTAVP